MLAGKETRQAKGWREAPLWAPTWIWRCGKHGVDLLQKVRVEGAYPLLKKIPKGPLPPEIALVLVRNKVFAQDA